MDYFHGPGQQSDLFLLPLEPEAQQALAFWDARDRAATTKLFLQVCKLHLAINAQKPDRSLTELRELLVSLEDEVFEWYVELADGVVAKLQKGYGGAANIAKYHAALQAGTQHQAKYQRLRHAFDRFLDE